MIYKTYSLVRKYKRPKETYKMLITSDISILYSQAESTVFVSQASGMVPWSHLFML